MASEHTPLSEEPVTVAFATDDGYAPYLLVAVASVLRRLQPGRRCDIVVLDQKIASFWRERLQDVVSSREGATLHLLEVSHLDGKLKSIFTRRGNRGKVTKWTYAAYYRLFLASLLPHCCRLVYLDVDTLACDDLVLLHDMDMKGRSVACATDVCLCFDPVLRESRRTLDVCGHDMKRYFNSGVLVIDLERWRATNFEERAAEQLCSLPHLVYPDQDILNILFRDDRVDLDMRWNFLTPQMSAGLDDECAVKRRDEIAASCDFGIIHFAGLKPWRRPEAAPFASLWWACARAAGVDGDIVRHESALLRSYLEAKEKGARLNSLRVQAVILRLQLVCAFGRRKEHLRGKLQRVRQKLQMARAARSRRLS